MSLTSLLDDRKGPVREFFETRLPTLKSMQTAWRAGGACTILPPQPVSWGLVGAGLDYRVRYLFTITPPDGLVAACGARTGRPHLREGFVRLAGALSSFLAANDPRHRVLASPLETELARYCYVLAMYESLFRANVADSPLFSLRDKDGATEQLALVPDADAADIVALARGAVQTLGHLFDRQVVANPTFAGSWDVGGADADLIVDSCLIDIKTTKRVGLDRKMIYQLLGYVLLDYDDEFALQEAGFYSSRVPLLLRWPLARLIAEASEGKETVGSLRAAFRALLATNVGHRG